MNQRGKHIISLIIFTFLWLALMAVIFYFSHQSADISSGQSLGVGKFIFKVVGISGNRQFALAILIERAIRKSAHFIEYALLGILTLGVFGKADHLFRTKRVARGMILQLDNYPSPKKRSFLVGALSLAWCIIYAVSDEIHQLYIPGRCGAIIDVILDAGGSLFGIALFVLFRYIFVHRKKHNQTIKV